MPAWTAGGVAVAVCVKVCAVDLCAAPNGGPPLTGQPGGPRPHWAFSPTALCRYSHLMPNRVGQLVLAQALPPGGGCSTRA